MDRRERRWRERERKKIEEKLKKEASRTRTTNTKEGSLRQRAREYFGRTISGTKRLKNLLFAGLALASAYALFHPHVSVEPQIVLNPVDPFSTAFVIKNESPIFPVHNLNFTCWTRLIKTSNNIRVLGMSPQQTQGTIPVLIRNASTTIGCPAVMGGLGSYTGAVQQAQIEMNISYKQTAWPLLQTESYPFASVRDSQGGVHWIHITSEQEAPFNPSSAK
jgi:hypothetical protein